MSLKSYLAKRARAGSKIFASKAPSAAQNEALNQHDPIDLVNGSKNLIAERESGTGEPGAMTATASTLDRTWAVDDLSPADSTPQRPEPNGMKFTYASGSKPLAGYTIKRGVGVGGFGEVYFALSDAGKEVALKRIQRNLDIEVRGVSHCLNLKHPNLISLFDIRYDESGQAWVVMEYVAGNSLRGALDKSPHGLSEREARRWFAALAAGVAHLHDAGIVHRDLKPGNIFDDDGIVKIGDYGLSKYISCSRKGGHTESVGTFHYMAPEVGRGNYGREIDIYAMGIILFELLTGTVPFDGESSHEIVMKHLTANPDLSAVAEPYRSVIWQALQKNPAARQQSVAQMIRPLGIEFDEHGLARASSGSVAEPVSQRFVNQSFDPGIQFGPTAGTPSPAMATATSAQLGRGYNAADVRFGEVRYHRPCAQPLSANSGSPAARLASGRAPEPLAHAVRTTASGVGRWWSSLEPYPGTRIILLIMAIPLLLLNMQWIFPVLTVLAIVYVPYYVIRAIILGVSRQPTYAEVHQRNFVRHQPPRVITAKQWRERKRSELSAKRSSVRAAELGGSMSTAVLSASILAAMTGLWSLWGNSWSSTAVAPFVWSGVVAATGALGVLFLGKLWEREEGSGLTRRFVMVGAGSAVGAAAFALANFLMIPLDEGLAREIGTTDLPRALYDSAGAPQIAALMAHFAVLMGSLRWWRIADPLRRSRVSIWALAVAVVGEWGLQQILPIPQPWGLLTAGLMSAAVQLSAPWENPKDRYKDAASQQALVA